ncbi:MAG: patatin-like phospholipase family protein [Gemmatimonadetes bacterium]|nr:patatin-like phospholipase family protein [Gemmatimonadota bacterium]
MKYTRIVCVLSGGGAKGAAHVGAVKAMGERGLAPGHFVGTSMGAIIGAMHASGLSYEAAVQRLTRLTRKDVAQLAPGALLGPLGRSILKQQPLRDTITRLVPAKRFDDLVVPLTVTTVDVATSELVLFGAGGRSDVPLHDALYASSALSVYYPPALMGGRAYADGGLRAVLPLDVAATLNPDLVVAVYTGPQAGEEQRGRPGRYGLLAAHDTAMRIMMAVQAEDAIARWNRHVPLVLIRPEVGARATFKVGDALKYVEEGYRAASRALLEWGGSGGVKGQVAREG